MEKYLQALEGISYLEWVKLRIGIDRAFEHQKGESEKQLKLANVDVAKQIIRTQFGQTLD